MSNISYRLAMSCRAWFRGLSEFVAKEMGRSGYLVVCNVVKPIW